MQKHTHTSFREERVCGGWLVPLSSVSVVHGVVGVQLLASSVAESREGAAGPLEHFSTSISSSNPWLFLWRTSGENHCKWPISRQSLKQFINKNNNPSSAWAHHKRRQPPNRLISQMKRVTFKCMQISRFRICSSRQILSCVYHPSIRFERAWCAHYGERQ